jgi:S-formylglutathione hydrolase FrmB
VKPVKPTCWLAVLLLLALLGPEATAAGGLLFGPQRLERANRTLHGQLLDFTRHHGSNRRVWSASLGEWRDLYVYLPPGFDPCQRYPLVIWLHGFAQDEQSFRRDVVEHIDEAMATGKLPRAILAVPDGSVNGHDCLVTAGTFFINTDAGRFEDWVMKDVWDFMFRNFPLRPEREAHVLAGVSMGGGAAYNLAIKYRDRVKVVFGIFPPLNSRWEDCKGRYRANFDPCCWGWLNQVRPCRVVGRFDAVVVVRVKHFIRPLYDRSRPEDEVIAMIAAENPIEMMDRCNLQPGELEMFIGYGGKDEFNIDAQVESFLWRARQRGLCICVSYDPRGTHSVATAVGLMPDLFEWLSPRLAPYSPPPCGPR